MDFKLYGFSHKLPALAAFVFASLAQLQVLPERFVRVKEALLRSVSTAAVTSGLRRGAGQFRLSFSKVGHLSVWQGA
jgi:secreted Zn-dependent insulinase-like peptidase